MEAAAGSRAVRRRRQGWFGAASGSKGKQSGSQTSNTEVQIPQFLRPLFEQGSGAAQRTLGNVERLAGGDVVAGFDPLQEQAFQSAQDVAGGAGGFIPQWQQLLQDTAGGTDVSSFLPQSSFDALSGAAGGGGGLEGSIPPESLEALLSSARGDFLAGGEGFDAAVNSAVQAATPQIASAFGSTRGGLSGALAKQAVGDTAVNAFASQYGNERNRQLSAAELLANLQGRDKDRATSAAGLLGNFGDRERDRQLSAGSQLPRAGLLSSDILSDVGGARQTQAQRELTGPLDTQMNLFQAITQGLDFEQLLGRLTNSSGRSKSSSVSGGKG